MIDQPRQPTAPTAEVYSQRANPAFEAELAARAASQEAAFFVSYVRRGMQVLDLGCGPGSITLGLAEAVAPGEVVGIDIQPAQVEQARALAAQRGATNVRFEVADVYRLPFPDRSFDAAFANMVLMHLREPARALTEMRRVLRPGGIAGVRDLDMGANLLAPATPLMEQFQALRVQVRRHNGGDPFLGRHLRRLLLEAGFARSEARAFVSSAGSPEETRRHAAFFKALLPGLARTAIAEGWVDQAMVDAMVAGIDAWAERPDAFHAGIACEVIGWVSD